MLASRAAVLLLAAVATMLAMALPSVLSAFRFKMELMAGLGLVYLLRWFWWRVTAWTEIAVLVTGPLVAVALNSDPGLFEGMPADAAFAWRLVAVVAASAVFGLATTLLSPPEPLEKLRAFYARVRPPALFWGPVADRQQSADRFSLMLAQFALAVAAIFSGMFAIGKLVLGEPAVGLALGALCGATSWLLGRLLR